MSDACRHDDTIRSLDLFAPITPSDLRVVAEAVERSVLDKIRARRDKMRKEPDELGGPPWQYQFARLFDDGAEFGPEPEYSHVILEGPSGESVNVLKDGEKIGSVNAEIFEYIKKLGAEEAKDGD